MFNAAAINAAPYRLANAEEIAAARDSGQHVPLMCTACGKSHWFTKGLAIGKNGGYTGARNIFYNGVGGECSCPPSALRMIAPDV